MTIQFIGEQRKTYRIQTGFWSFDQAFKNRSGAVGFPVRGICEISGWAGVGKSTLATSLSGIIGKELGVGIALADLEDHFDEDLARKVLEGTGFTGDFFIAPGELDTEKLEAMLLKLRDGSYAIGIVDSIGAISPIAEVEGGLEESSMGRRAKVVAVLSRRAIHFSNYLKKPYIIFATNHVHAVMGGRGTVTSGGVVKDYLCTTRIRLKSKEIFDDGSTLLNGKVDKNSFGYSHRAFNLVNVVGWGFHPGLTAVFDCVDKKLATNSRVVKLGDKSYGYMKQLIASPDDFQLFEPFQQALKDNKVRVDEIVSKGKDEYTYPEDES